MPIFNLEQWYIGLLKYFYFLFILFPFSPIDSECNALKLHADKCGVVIVHAADAF